MTDQFDFNLNSNMLNSDMDMDAENDLLSKPTLNDVISELRIAGDDVPSDTVLHGLSDLMPDEWATLAPVWAALNVPYRRILVQMLVDVSDANYLLDYETVGFGALRDEDALVRQAAIELLTDNDTLGYMRQLIEMSQHDPAEDVRAEATKALGRFIWWGEVGDLPDDSTVQAENRVLEILQNQSESPLVRRRALESIAHCSRKGVRDAIQIAYASDDLDDRISAVIAMGRSCDNRWTEIVLHELNNRDARMRVEAARASGELRLDEAVPTLGQIFHEDEREAQEAVIWALGEIANREAIRILEIASEMAEDADDEAMLVAIEEALGNASLNKGDFMMFDFGAYDFDDELDDEDDD